MGAGSVALPFAFARKNPSAATTWAWQWVFPATRLYVDRDSGLRRRHHLHESVVQRAIREAVRLAGIRKPATCHTLKTFLRDAPAPEWLRHADPPGTRRPQRHQHHHDLYARPIQWPLRRPKPVRRHVDRPLNRRRSSQGPACHVPSASPRLSQYPARARSHIGNATSATTQSPAVQAFTALNPHADTEYRVDSASNILYSSNSFTIQFRQR